MNFQLGAMNELLERAVVALERIAEDLAQLRYDAANRQRVDPFDE